MDNSKHVASEYLNTQVLEVWFKTKADVTCGNEQRLWFYTTKMAENLQLGLKLTPTVIILNLDHRQNSQQPPFFCTSHFPHIACKVWASLAAKQTLYIYIRYPQHWPFNTDHVDKIKQKGSCKVACRMQGRRNYLKNNSVCTKLIYANVSSVFIECSCSKEYGTSCGLIQASSSLTGDLCLITAVSSTTIDFSFCEFHFNLDSKVSKRVIFFSCDCIWEVSLTGRWPVLPLTQWVLLG